MITNELKAARIKKGLTQEKLSNKLGISTPSFSKKERGLIPFSINEVSVLKETLELTPDEVYKIFFTKEVALKTTNSA